VGRLKTKRLFLGVVVVGAALFLIVVPVARSQFQSTPLEVLEAADIAAEMSTQNEYSQIQTTWGEQKLWLTQESKNHIQPHRSGRWIVWVTLENNGGKIERYDLYTGSYSRITEEGMHQKPRVNKTGQVVWETWVDDVWKVSYSDGSSTQIISTQTIGINPDISQSAVLYHSREPGGEWSAQRYDLNTKSTESIKTGPDAKLTRFNEAGEIFTAASASPTQPFREIVSGIVDVILGNPAPNESIPVGVFVQAGDSIAPEAPVDTPSEEQPNPEEEAPEPTEEDLTTESLN
jgi:hypothetical protein